MFKWIFRGVVVFLSLALTLTAFLIWISPKVWILPTFLGLSYLPLLLCVLICMLYLLFSWSKWTFVPLLALVLTIPNLTASFGKQWKVDEHVSFDGGVKVATLNTHLFNYFEQPNTQAISKSVQEDLKAVKADIICLQEFLSYKSHSAKAFAKKLGFEHFYFYPLKDGRKVGVFGMLILSKFPISDTGTVHFNPLSGNIGAWVTLDINGNHCNVFSAHLQSIGLNKGDFSNMESPQWQKSKNTLATIQKAAEKRSEQVELMRKQMATFKDPLILVGDFNAPPVSYTYKKLRKGMKDAFVESGFGLEQTYNGKIPGMRIDYILFSEALESLSYMSKKVDSDHKMVISNIRWKTKVQ